MGHRPPPPRYMDSGPETPTSIPASLSIPDTLSLAESWSIADDSQRSPGSVGSDIERQDFERPHVPRLEFDIVDNETHIRRDSTLSYFQGNAAAKQAILHEQNMPFLYAANHYKLGLAWSAVMASTAMMEGYELGLVATFFTYRAFTHFYGSPTDGDPERAPRQTAPTRGSGVDFGLPSPWPTGISISIAVGQFSGLFLAPALTRRFGYRYASFIAVLMIFGFTMIPIGSGFVSEEAQDALGTRRGLYLAGQLLLGVPCGIFQSMLVPYISDVTPLKLRGPATTLVNVFWLCGQLLSAVVLRSTEVLGVSDGPSEILEGGNTGEWAFRVPILVQYAWIVPFAVFVLLIPESPLTLLRKGRDNEALVSIRQLNNDPQFDPQGSLDALRLVNHHGEDAEEHLGFLACF